MHFTDQFETIQTGGLVDVAGDGAGLGTRGEEVVFALDFCLFEDVLVDGLVVVRSVCGGRGCSIGE